MTKLAKKRAETASRNSPNTISSCRLRSACANRAPYGTKKLDIGATMTTPIIDTKPDENGGRRRCVR